eukprot:10936-Heterococcus_DN1.PRE.2
MYRCWAPCTHTTACSTTAESQHHQRYGCCIHKIPLSGWLTCRPQCSDVLACYSAVRLALALLPRTRACLCGGTMCVPLAAA